MLTGCTSAKTEEAAQQETDGKEENVTNIPYKMAFKETQSLSDKVENFMDEDFWGAYNIIEPTESLESAVNKLKKQQK